MFATSLDALAPVLGLFLAFKFDFPASPAIVAVGAIILATAWLGNVFRRS